MLVRTPNYIWLSHSLTQKPLNRQTECGVDGTIQRHTAEWVVDDEDVVCQCWVVDMQLMGANRIHQKCAAQEIKFYMETCRRCLCDQGYLNIAEAAGDDFEA